ncbi:MAG: hypothetical protein AB7P20_03615 [Rhizobiaceae bacterium]
MKWIRMLAVAGLIACGPIAVLAQTTAPPATIELTGGTTSPIALTPDMLAGLPQIEQDVTFQTSKGPSSGHYKGVLFWEVLKANKALDGLQRNGELQKTFLVTAKDDYKIAFSVGEIHPEFGNTPLMIATEVDGKPIEGGPRIVVPGDKRGARAVQEIVKIEIR